jgi:uncharacterized protein YxjI
MFKNLTYKNKLRLLIAGIVLSGLLIYNLSISRTFKLKGECNKIETKLEMVSKLPIQIQKLNNQINQLDKLFGDNHANEENSRSHIIKKCSNYCKRNKITIIQIKESIIKITDDLIIETNELHFKGSYKKLLLLIHELESSKLPGKISSASFIKQKNRRTKLESLNLVLYIQSVSKNQQS